MANQTVYPFGTNGSLPASVGIVNDLRTGGVDKALSAEQGVVIGEELYGKGRTHIDLSVLTEYGVYVTIDTNKWAESTTTGFVFIPVSPGEKYKVYASRDKYTVYFVTQDSSHTAGTTPTYATGYSEAIPVNANSESEQFTIPEDGHFIVLWTTASSNRMDVSVYKIEEDVVTTGLVGRVDTVEDKTATLEDETQWIGKMVVDFSLFPAYKCYIDINTGIWTPWETTDVVFVPVSPGDVLKMKASSLGTTYALLQTDSHDAGTVAQYCVGHESGILVNADETEEITIPNDGHYLAVWTKLTSGNTTPTLYSMTFSSVSKLIDRVYALEDYKNAIDFEPAGIKDNEIDYVKGIQIKTKVLTIREQEMSPTSGVNITAYDGHLYCTIDGVKYEITMTQVNNE